MAEKYIPGAERARPRRTVIVPPSERVAIKEREREKKEAIADREARTARARELDREKERKLPAGGGIVGGVGDIPGIKEHREKAKTERLETEKQKAIAEREARPKTITKEEAKQKRLLAELKKGPKVSPEDLPREAPPEFMRPKGEIATKRTKEIYKAQTKDYSELKGFVPWLDFSDDWKELKGRPVDKAAYLAGQIGQTILYVAAGAGIIKGVLAKAPVKGAPNTFPKTKGVRVISKGDVKQIVKDIAKEKGVTPKELEKTVPFEKPIKPPKDTIIIVNESPTGRLEFRAARLGPRPIESLPERPGWPKPIEPKELSKGGRGRTLAPERPKGGGARPAPPSIATMTRDQLARQLGVDIETIGMPVIFPLPKPGEAPPPVPLPSPKPTPIIEPSPKPEPQPAPMPKPEPKPGPSPKPEPKPEPAKTPEPIPVPEPPPKGGTGPAPGPIPVPIPQPVPAPQPSPKPEPAPVPPPEPIPVEEKPPPPLKGGPPRLPPRFILSPKPRTTAPESEKREYLEKVEGFVARRRGSLSGQSVWRINFYPYGKGDEFTIVGAAPKGAKLATGKGSVARSATLLKGVPPRKPIYSDTGAVDDIIRAEGRRIIVRSVQDKRIATRRALER